MTLRIPPLRQALVAGAFIFAGCQSGPGRRPIDHSNDPVDSGMRFRGADLSTSSTLLEALRNRMPTMDVAYPTDGRCPRIALRGQRSARTGQEPTIYMDDTRMANTCALIQVSSSEIDSVLVFTTGTPRPHIPSSPFGLILVYRARR